MVYYKFGLNSYHSFYPSKIEHYKPNPFIDSRYHFGEICEEAKKRNLKIIARLDFTGASSELSGLYPGWFHLNKDGSYKSHGGSNTRISTTPAGGYKNGDFYVYLLDAESGKLLEKLEHDASIDGLSFSSKGSMLATGSEKRHQPPGQ